MQELCSRHQLQTQSAPNRKLRSTARAALAHEGALRRCSQTAEITQDSLGIGEQRAGQIGVMEYRRIVI